MSKIGSKIGTAALVVVLLGLLAVSIWFASQSWLSVDGPPLPTQGYIAMILGVVFSVLIGCGLMALVFYSHRHGYDEASNRDQRRPDHDRDQMQGS
jgi:type VI protein secretion system component VasK